MGLDGGSGFELTLEGATVSQAQVNPGTSKMVLKLSYSDPDIKPVLIPFNAIIDSCEVTEVKVPSDFAVIYTVSGDELKIKLRAE